MKADKSGELYAQGRFASLCAYMGMPLVGLHSKDSVPDWKVFWPVTTLKPLGRPVLAQNAIRSQVWH